jgi:hypothetical protein
MFWHWRERKALSKAVREAMSTVLVIDDDPGL